LVRRHRPVLRGLRADHRRGGDRAPPTGRSRARYPRAEPMTRPAIVAIGVLLLLSACSVDAPDDARPLVIATTSIVGDLVGHVAGDEARVEVLIPVGADPHDFAPSAQQAAGLRRADLVVTSGLGLEAGLADALGSAADDGVP